MIDTLLSNLSNVRQTGFESWIASCPLHSDTNPSLAVAIKDDVILLHCFSCHGDIHDLTAAIGMTASDLFSTDSMPANNNGSAKPHRRKHFPARDVLSALTQDIYFTEICAHRIVQGGSLTPEELNLLRAAANRMGVAREYVS